MCVCVCVCVCARVCACVCVSVAHTLLLFFCFALGPKHTQNAPGKVLKYKFYNSTEDRDRERQTHRDREGTKRSSTILNIPSCPTFVPGVPVKTEMSVNGLVCVRDRHVTLALD